MKRRVVVVSAGVVSPLGGTWPEFRKNVFLERDWFSTLPESLPYPSAALVDSSNIDRFYRCGGRSFKYRRYYNRATDMAVMAVFECLDRAGPTQIDLEKLSILWGAGPNFDMGSVPEGVLAPADPERGEEAGTTAWRRKASAAWMLLYLPNMTASAISCALGTHGGALTYVTACAAASHAIGEAYTRIRDGHADAVLCGGADSRISREGLMAYRMIGALSTSPEPRVLPMCAERDGFVPGEGAAAFLLIDLPGAVTLGLPILAEVLGHGSSSDGFRLTDPDPEGLGMERSMRQALERAGTSPASIDLINAHGTGTQMNDSAEASAIRRLFKTSPPVTSNKSQFGHLSAAAGAVEFAACLAMLDRQCVTPTVNTQGREIEAGIDLVRECRPQKIDTILSNSFGFGGQNSTLIIRRWAP
ncbi:MAG: beta-ketoacyl-[acyl-carrier-protein] synthase family protein [Syntrophobacteraceae bacterium]|nr:beta-ketoacyl-[acyl-carrier-protein] synthase family protein [Desulfobacteraceae bacterium]